MSGELVVVALVVAQATVVVEAVQVASATAPYPSQVETITPSQWALVELVARQKTTVVTVAIPALVASLLTVADMAHLKAHLVVVAQATTTTVPTVVAVEVPIKAVVVLVAPALAVQVELASQVQQAVQVAQVHQP